MSSHTAPPEPGPRPPVWPVLVGFLLAGFLLVPCAAGGGFLLGWLARAPATAQASEPALAAAPAPTPAEKKTGPPGPYPESARLLESLRKCVDDPEGLEVLDWGAPVHPLNTPPGFRTVALHVRVRNRHGAKERQQWIAQLDGDRVTGWEVSDLSGVTGLRYIPAP